jgi:DNA repair photolyase
VFVRWDNLGIDGEEARQLPGYRDEAVVRRFDAPEALDTRFYEVRAKSALNRVPKQSRMPFRFTINPYRGCSHACAYCMAPNTPVSMADGTTKPIAHIRAGDEIYGTVRSGVYRRYTKTQVLAHWATRKRAYRILLEDGTELVASGDHRFLTRRGWKFVTGSQNGRARRPHLTSNDKLMGTGTLPETPSHTASFRRGYLCGLIRGDGHLGSYTYARRAGGGSDHHRFRLALIDDQALHRARDYLSEIGVATQTFAFQPAGAIGASKPIMAIRTSARRSVESVRAAIAWPHIADDDWRRGFLAGIFDAEGCHSASLRIANTDAEILDWTFSCLRGFGFDAVREPTRESNGLTRIRVRGGVREHLRFFQTTDPAITRKRTITGTAIKSDAPLRIVSVEPMPGLRELFDITTGTGDFIANGVVSHNCFARPTHTYLGFNAGRDFEREIVVKVNLPEVLRAELKRPSWKREHVALGTNTDPYQWVEGRYRLMPEVWAALRDSGTPCSVLTKSPLLLRDIDLMCELAEQVGFTANLSVPTLDEKAWRASEPHTPHPRKRLEAVAELARAGIPTGILIAPLMPGINDRPEQVEEILALAAEAGAGSAGGVGLHLRGEVRQVFMDWLASYRPDLVERYRRLYARGAYLPRAESERLGAIVTRGRRRFPPTGKRAPLLGARFHARDGSPEPRASDDAYAPEGGGERQESLF